jgi:hypothetical protein
MCTIFIHIYISFQIALHDHICLIWFEFKFNWNLTLSYVLINLKIGIFLLCTYTRSTRYISLFGIYCVVEDVGYLDLNLDLSNILSYF